MSSHRPVVGCWFQERSSNQVFEIVACDPDEGTVQIQHLDGELADYDLEHWAQLDLQRAAEPEDWSKVFEMEPDSAWNDDGAGQAPQWGNPLARIEPEMTLGVDEF